MLSVHSGVGQAPGHVEICPSSTGHHPGHHEPVCELLPGCCQVSPHPTSSPPSPPSSHQAVPREGCSEGPRPHQPLPYSGSLGRSDGVAKMSAKDLFGE